MSEAPAALEGAYPVEDAVVQAFRRDGHAIVRKLASAEEVDAFRPGLEAAAEAAPRVPYLPLDERDTYGKAFLQMFNLWRQNEMARTFVFARRFARVAAELMGVSAVRLYHDQALFKEPGGGPTPWHQDQFYWPLETDHTITMWMPLTTASPEMGLMTFASGSHLRRSLGDFAIGDESQAEFDRVVREEGLPQWESPAFEPGDASFHAGWTLHRAEGNRTRRMREAMTIIYYADGTCVGPLDHPNRQFDRDVWLQGCEPGDLAAGPLNPVLYAEE